MNTLVIFTSLDDATRRYFTLFFGQPPEKSDFKFLSIENMIFISDDINMPQITGLNSLININSEASFFVFYHKSAKNIPIHKKYIRSIIKSEVLIEVEDHHNSDGAHYQYVLNGAIALSEGNIEEFKNQINLLLNFIKSKLNGN